MPTVLPPHLANNKYVMECHERKKVEHQAIMDEAAERARLASGMPKVGLCGSVHLGMLHNDLFLQTVVCWAGLNPSTQQTSPQLFTHFPHKTPHHACCGR